MELTREKILGAVDYKIETIEVPEWGGTVSVKSLSGKGRDAFEGSRLRFKENNKVEMVYENTRARLLSMTLCDVAGKLLFTEEDIEVLGEKNAAVLDRLFDVAQRLSSLRPADVEQKLKNSEAVQIVNSSSLLHSN